MKSRSPHATGQSGEQIVADALVREGWSVLARNWRAAGGELDLVVERDGRLRFVEVKTRSPEGADASGALDPTGLESIHKNKRQRLIAAANAWLDTRGLPAHEAAFLIALVSPSPAGARVEWWDDPL